MTTSRVASPTVRPRAAPTVEVPKVADPGRARSHRQAPPVRVGPCPTPRSTSPPAGHRRPVLDPPERGGARRRSRPPWLREAPAAATPSPRWWHAGPGSRRLGPPGRAGTGRHRAVRLLPGRLPPGTGHPPGLGVAGQRLRALVARAQPGVPPGARGPGRGGGGDRGGRRGPPVHAVPGPAGPGALPAPGVSAPPSSRPEPPDGGFRGFVLCGGSSTRMGRDKALIGDPPWAHRVAGALLGAGCWRPPCSAATRRWHGDRTRSWPTPGRAPARPQQWARPAGHALGGALVAAACDLPLLAADDVVALAATATSTGRAAAFASAAAPSGPWWPSTPRWWPTSPPRHRSRGRPWARCSVTWSSSCDPPVPGRLVDIDTPAGLRATGEQGSVNPRSDR